MSITTIILSTIGILGTVGTFYFGIKSIRLERVKNSFTWKDVERGAIGLLKTAEKTFHPDIVLMTSGPGAIVASLAMIQSGRFFPTFTAILEDKRGPLFQTPPKGHLKVSTKKWNIFIPEQICDETDKKILIMDDCVMSGDVYTALCQFLEDNNFHRENIFFATLVCSKMAVECNKAPDLYWHLNPHSDLYFPWGRWF